MADRPELEPYIGRTVTIEADITSRSDGGQYGFLLADIVLSTGERVDHCWLQIYNLDLAEISGERIRCMAKIDRYWKAGRREGKYVEFAELGTGISGICDVCVREGDDWIPLCT